MRRPSVLYVTCHLPYPPIGGGRRRDYELLRRLADDFDLALCVVSKTIEQDELHAPVMRQHCSTVKVVPAAPFRPAAGSTQPQHVLRHRSPEALQWMREFIAAAGVDLIHVEGYYLLQHVPPSCPVPVLLVEQNVEYLLFRQQAATATARRPYMESQISVTRRAEHLAWRRSSLCATVSEDDCRYIQETMPGLDVRLTPNGADHLDTELDCGCERPQGWPSDGPSVVFVANFGYEPNVDAAVHLCEEIFPPVRWSVPTARLLLVGASPPPGLVELGQATPGVSVIGRVPSVVPYLRAADLVVCPLRIGGGVKVKLLEAIHLGKAIVSTSVGIQGMGHAVRDCVEVRDDPGNLAQTVVDVLRSQQRRHRLEHATAVFARALPSWDDAASAVASCYRELLGVKAPLGGVTGLA
jgi:glycosyltransferase involved in cell wall biosynthesis